MIFQNRNKNITNQFIQNRYFRMIMWHDIVCLFLRYQSFALITLHPRWWNNNWCVWCQNCKKYNEYICIYECLLVTVGWFGQPPSQNKHKTFSSSALCGADVRSKVNRDFSQILNNKQIIKPNDKLQSSNIGMEPSKVR